MDPAVTGDDACARPYAVVFAGQGGQRVGMGRDIHRAIPAARAVFEEASDAIGFDVAALCFEPDRRLGLTAFAQPALLTVEIAILRALQLHGWGRPAVWGGHSLGEYAALVGAEILPFAEAVRLVHRRGVLMQATVAAGVGSLVALSGRDLNPEAVAACLGGLKVDIACINGPEQVVIAGLAEDVAVARQRLQAVCSSATARDLPASVPFHSRLLSPMLPDFQACLEEAAWAPDKAHGVAANLTGGFHNPDRHEIVARLTRHIVAPVRWADNATALAAAARRIIEIGPTSTLRPFFRHLGIKVDLVSGLNEVRHVG